MRQNRQGLGKIKNRRQRVSNTIKLAYKESAQNNDQRSDG